MYVFLQYNSKFKINVCTRYLEFKYIEHLKYIQQDYYEIENKFNSVGFSGCSLWLTVTE